MIVSRVILKNWRNFASVDAKLGERVFVVGPNASGKSNFLDAFRFLRDIAKPGGGLQKAVEERGGLSKIRCLAARRHPDVQIQIDLSDPSDQGAMWTYSIGIRQESRGYRRVLLSHERVVKDGVELVVRPVQEDKRDDFRLTQTYLEQISANADFREIAHFLEAVLYLHLVPQLVRVPEAFSGPGIPGDPYGLSFLKKVAQTPERTRKSRLSRIETTLREAVPQLSQLSYRVDDLGRPHVEALYEHWISHGARQREDQFSDGTLRLVGLLWSLLEGESLLLLEEPELSLNGEIVRRLAPLFSRIMRQRKRQVMVSTHSADLLTDKGIGGDEVLLLVPSAEGTIVQPASDDAEIRALLEGGLSIADAALPRVAPRNLNQLELPV